MKYLICSFALAATLIGEWDQRAIDKWNISPQAGCHITSAIPIASTAGNECALPVPGFFEPLLIASETERLVATIEVDIP